MTLPAGAEALLALLSTHGQAIAGDLLEESEVIESRQGPAAARRWLRRQLAASLWPLALRRLQGLSLPLLAAAASSALTFAGCCAFWAWLLAGVPLRASHPPSLPLLLAAVAASLFAGLLGFAAGRALPSRRTP